MKIGFIGLGGMGSGMAARLLEAGHELTVWNRSPEAAEPLRALGARVAETAEETLSSEAVFTMLATDAAIEAVLLKEDVLAKAAPGLIHVCCATISVDLARRLTIRHQELGQTYVSAPVLGRPDAARQGGLAMILAGPETALEALAPAFEAVSRVRFPIGSAPEQANVVKLACNFALAVMIETLGETGALVSAYDVPPKALYEVMTSTLFAAPAYRIYADLITEGRFEPAGFKLPLGLKDVRLALAAGEARNVALPLGSEVRDRFIEALAAGDGEKDWSALAAGAFRRAGRTDGR